MEREIRALLRISELAAAIDEAGDGGPANDEIQTICAEFAAAFTSLLFHDPERLERCAEAGYIPDPADELSEPPPCGCAACIDPARYADVETPPTEAELKYYREMEARLTDDLPDHAWSSYGRNE